MTDPKGNQTRYTYNPQNNLLTNVHAQSSAGTVENSYGYDTADRLNTITHNGGSGFQLGYSYDAYDRVTAINKNGAAAYQYSYDARGNLARMTDKTGGTDLTTAYSYDLGDRLNKKSASDGTEVQYHYDNMDRSTETRYTFAGQSRRSIYAYGSDSRKSGATLFSEGSITPTYDSLNREYITDILDRFGSTVALRAQRSYVNVSGNRSTTLVDTYSNLKHTDTSDTTLSKYSYVYDINGNISAVTDKDGNVTTYTYDQMNQLVRTDDEKAGVSSTYSYDVGGNIIEVSTYTYTTGTLGVSTGTVSYAYGNSDWKDLLTGYNGQNITYDAIGNPLTYRGGMTFTWEGRQLKTAVANGKNMSYTYNSDGIRTGKTVDGMMTKYLVDGSNIIAQQTGSNILWFLYDSDETRVGFTYNGTAYYYTKNAQGDVTGIVDGNCNTVVGYQYDAWGKLLNTTGSLASTIGTVNPFRYRGYYYDAESGLYYLSSRYYDPQTGRFISEDGQLNPDTGLAGNNLFAYCNNDPITMVDYDGNRMLVEPGIETPDEQVMAAKYENEAAHPNIMLYEEHKSNARPSTEEKHQRGQSRKQRDSGGEKGDKRRNPNPNKRRPNNIQIETPEITPSKTWSVGVGTVAAGIILSDDVSGIGFLDDILLIPVLIFLG